MAFVAAHMDVAKVWKLEVELTENMTSSCIALVAVFIG